MSSRATAMIVAGLLAAGALAFGLSSCGDNGTPSSSAPASSAAPPESSLPASSSSAPPASETPPASEAPPASSSAPPESSAPPPSSTPAPPPPSPASFSFNPPGQLQSGAPGIHDTTIYVPGMRFPIDAPDAYADSQVYGHGGDHGPGGGQCDAVNYSYPWSDNFCEPRPYSTPLCPSGTGHQGDDIRPNSCKAAVYTGVAAEPGVISQIGSYTVYLSSDTGRTYLYLHMQMNKLKVHLGDRVVRGQPLGLVSNNFGSTATTIHLHFEIKEPVSHNGATITTRVPPYTSVVDAYQRLLAGTP